MQATIFDVPPNTI